MITTQKKNLSDYFVSTYKGKKVYVLDPKADMIDLDDIVHSLSLSCRFNGHCKHMYSIADHSMLVADLVSEEAKLYALLHDSAEAYLADICRPLKQAINRITNDLIKEIEHNLLHAINMKFCLPDIPKNIKTEVKLADNTALWIEAHEMFDEKVLEIWEYGDLLNPIPDIKLTHYQTSEKCEEVFKNEILKYYKERMSL